MHRSRSYNRRRGEACRRLAALLLALLLAPLQEAALSAQTVAAPAAGQERFPTTRDPSYQPPISGRRTGNVSPEAAAAVSALSGESSSLEQFYRARRRQLQERRRRSGAYREREIQSLLDQGREQTALERMMLRQFGQNSFGPGFGRLPEEEESDGQRYARVSILALPLTCAISFGLLQAGRLAGGESAPPPNGQSWAAFGLGLIGALLVGWKDYSDLQALRAAESQSWRQRRYLEDLGIQAPPATGGGDRSYWAAWPATPKDSALFAARFDF
ncbi:MAG: hypothetical protein K1X75_09935 [Leptospirales bacterium]|nr:hypothetical protein [Leptospirales bacterium]